MEKRQKNRIVLSCRYSDTRFRRKKTGSSQYDKNNHVHCDECPLRKGYPTQYDFRCKANSHYNRHTREWEYDD